MKGIDMCVDTITHSFDFNTLDKVATRHELFSLIAGKSIDKIVTLPGPSMMFEQMVSDNPKHTRTRIIGIENNPDIVSIQRNHNLVACGRVDLRYTTLLEYFKSLVVDRDNQEVPFMEKCDMIWFDSCSTICKELVDTLKFIISSRAIRIEGYFALTFQLSRTNRIIYNDVSYPISKADLKIEAVKTMIIEEFLLAGYRPCTLLTKKGLSGTSGGTPMVTYVFKMVTTSSKEFNYGQKFTRSDFQGLDKLGFN